MAWISQRRKLQHGALIPNIGNYLRPGGKAPEPTNTSVAQPARSSLSTVKLGDACRTNIVSLPNSTDMRDPAWTIAFVPVNA